MASRIQDDRPVAIYALLDSARVVRYVGQTVSLKARLNDHRQVRSWFASHADLEWTTQEAWENRERYWLAFFKAQGCTLENRTEGGGGCCRPQTSEQKAKISAALKGRIVSKETRRRMSIAQIGIGAGRILSLEHKRKLSLANKGRRPHAFTEETCRRMSIAQLGKKRKPHTEATKQKISRSHIGCMHTLATRAKLSTLLKGRKLSPTHREHIRLAQLGHHRGGWKLSVETKRRISEARKGKKKSQETRERMRVAWIKRKAQQKEV